MKKLMRNLAKIGSLVGILAISMPAMAVITITVDPGGGDVGGTDFNDCSVPANCTVDGSNLTCIDFRSALDCAEQDATAGAPSTVINLPAETIILTSELDVNASNLDINGAGRDVTVLDGNNNDTVLDVNLNGLMPGQTRLTIRDLSIINGDGGGSGGGIDNSGKFLDIFNVRFFNNTSDAGGAIQFDTNGGGGSPDLRIRDSIFEQNSADEGGAIYINDDFAGGATGSEGGIRRTSFFNNETNMGGVGSAIFVENGTLEMFNVTVAENIWDDAIMDNGAIFLNASDDTHRFQNVAVTDPIVVGAGAELELVNSITTECVETGVITEPVIGGGNLTVAGSGCIDEGLAGNFTSPDVAGLGLGTLVVNATEGAYYPLVLGGLAIDNANAGAPVGTSQITGDADVRPIDGNGDGIFREDIGPIEFDPSGLVDVCGNGLCEAGEDATSCPGDCGVGVCGNGLCEPEAGEDETTCATDCGAGVCGNLICEAGEDISNCAVDCEANPQTIIPGTDVSGGGCSLNQALTVSSSAAAMMLLGLSVLASAVRFRNKRNS